MAADSENRPPLGEPPQGESAGRPAPAARVRILFGCIGWPSGILELASWVKHRQLAEPVIFQVHPGDAPEEQFLKRLLDFDPHVVGFRLESGQLEQIKKLIRTVRQFSGAEIILGGPTATSHPQELLEDSGADYVFAGEAEKSLSQFLRLAWRRNSKDRQPEIPGLAYRYGGRTYLNTLPGDGYQRTVMDVDGLVCCNTLRCLRGRVRPVTEVELIAASPFTIPLYDSDTRRLLEYGGWHSHRRGSERAPPNGRGPIRHFTDYERPQPGWMDPLTAELAELADAELQFAINLEQRDGALTAAFEAVLDGISRQRQSFSIRQLRDQALWAMDRIREARFRAV